MRFDTRITAPPDECSRRVFRLLSAMGPFYAIQISQLFQSPDVVNDSERQNSLLQVAAIGFTRLGHASFNFMSFIDV